MVLFSGFELLNCFDKASSGLNVSLCLDTTFVFDTEFIYLHKLCFNSNENDFYFSDDISHKLKFWYWFLFMKA